MITTNGKTNEEIVKEIFAALVQQGKRCLDGDGNCCHGDADGNHCGIGFLLPEGGEAMSYEGTVSGLIDDYLGDLGENMEWMKDNFDLCVEIQGVHDSVECVLRTGLERIEEHIDVDDELFSMLRKWFDIKDREAGLQ